MKRIISLFMIIGFILISGFGSVNIKTKATSELSYSKFIHRLSKLEYYISDYSNNQGKTDIIRYIENTDKQLSDYVQKKDKSLDVLKDIQTVNTPIGRVNAKQLVRGIIRGDGKKDYIKYAANIPSIKALTAMDEYNINSSKQSSVSVSDSIKEYYSHITRKERVSKFVDCFYSSRNMKWSVLKKEIYKANFKLGIKNSESIANYLYQNYPDHQIKNIKIGETILDVGSSGKFKCSIFPQNAKYNDLSFYSKNPEILDVTNDGVYNAKRTESAKLRVYSKNFQREVVIHVLNPVEELNDKTKTDEIQVGKQMQVKVNVFPENATIKELQYTSNNESIATVDQAGFVLAKKPGYVTISVKSYNGIIITHRFRVYQKMRKIKTPKNLILVNGKQEKIKYNIYPLGITDDKVEFESSNEEVVTIDGKGIIYPKKNGKAQIIVQSKGIKDIYAVSNVEIITKMEQINPETRQSYYINHPQKFQYHVTPESTSNKTLSYQMKKNEYASVKEDGTIIPKKIGQTILTVQSEDGTKLKKTVQIFIEQMIENISVKNKIYLKKGESFQLYYTIAPVNATKKSVTLKSDNDNKIKISNKDIVTAVEYGKTKVTIQANDPSHTKAICYIIVKRPIWHYIAICIGFIFGLSIIYHKYKRGK